jgi:hypothetical protein
MLYFRARIIPVHFILQHLYVLCMSNSSLTADHWLLSPLSNMVVNPSIDIIYQQILFFWHNSPHWARVSSFLRFLAHHRDLCLIHNTHNRRTLMPPCGILTHNLSKRSATDLLLRPRGHWDWHSIKWKVFYLAP